MLLLNLTTNEVHIPQTNTKTDTERSVGITTRLYEELKILWKGSLKDKKTLVFGITGDIKKACKTACDKADVENFRLHDCRHTAATRMIASGSPHTEVMKITGHTQLKTFLRYLSIRPETAKRCAMRLDDYFNQSIPPSIASKLLKQVIEQDYFVITLGLDFVLVANLTQNSLHHFDKLFKRNAIFRLEPFILHLSLLKPKKVGF